LMDVMSAVVNVSLAVIVHDIPDFTPEPYTQGDAATGRVRKTAANGARRP
jgi:hypothetical protein